MMPLFSVKRIVSVWVLVCVLLMGARPVEAAGAPPANGPVVEAQALPLMVACGVYTYYLSYLQYYSRMLPPVTGNSGTVYRCGIIGIDGLILDEVLDPYHQQLSSDIFNTLSSIESVQTFFYEQEGISQFEFKARCDMTIESGCPMQAQYEISLTISSYSAEDFCMEEWCICRENWHCEEGLVCRPFFTEFAGSYGECVRSEWWLD